MKTGVHFLAWNETFLLEKDQNNVPGHPDASYWSSTSLALSVIYFVHGSTNPVFSTVKASIHKKRNILKKEIPDKSSSW